ncbi:hypothetical protein [Chryseobacterium sp. EO14]|uniref:hypothetical protein n=1 Tax=Chryseobacterium sp. EO14 TaxID=2950551 RepID=UPI00210A4EFF|nr:hypothetical protein [Chryseobacterium sp. EO14]MCQ4139187.1 hypothetical protein [Chryseobacterium sp. EO14]
MKENENHTEKSVKDIRKIKSINTINFIIEDLKIDNVNQLSEYLGFSRPERLYKVLRGENAISKKLAEEINSKFPQYSIDFLLSGIDSAEIPVTILPAKDGLKSGIPFYNVDFAGGWSSDVLFSETKPDFYISNPEFNKAEFACNLIGNSVSRRIPNRSIIGLKLIENWQIYFPTNELYGIVMKNELRTVKIVKRSREKEGYLILVPDPLPEFNVTQYEPEEVPIEFVARFYQIIAWAQFERISM